VKEGRDGTGATGTVIVTGRRTAVGSVVVGEASRFGIRTARNAGT
jgi:hypothetical protein